MHRFGPHSDRTLRWIVPRFDSRRAVRERYRGCGVELFREFRRRDRRGHLARRASTALIVGCRPHSRTSESSGGGVLGDHSRRHAVCRLRKRAGFSRTSQSHAESVCLTAQRNATRVIQPRLAQIMLESTAQAPKYQPEQKPKSPAAVALGRLGGLKGGDARAAKLGRGSHPDRGESGEKMGE
jgi:hypothetical protein